MIPIKDNIPTDRFPFVTVALIVVNVIVYLLSIRHGGSLISGPATDEVIRYGAIPRALTHPGVHCAEVAVQAAAGTAQPALICNTRALAAAGIPAQNTLPTWTTVLSSMFVHGSILHLAGNMLFLWIFGTNVEDAMGRAKFLAFYLIGGVAALALQTLVGPNAAVPTVGASGAVAAVLGGYILLYPRARVVTVIFLVIFFTVLELPALVVLGLWFVEQAVFGATNLTDPTGGGGGVAYFAHIGGFIFGLLVIRAIARAKPLPARLPVY